MVNHSSARKSVKVGLLAIWLTAGAPGLAHAAWSAPEPVSGVAVIHGHSSDSNSAGLSAVGWVEHNPDTDRAAVKIRVRASSGLQNVIRLGGYETPSENGVTDASAPAVAVSADGTVSAIWNEPGTVVGRVKTPNGGFGSRQTLAPGDIPRLGTEPRGEGGPNDRAAFAFGVPATSGKPAKTYGVILNDQEFKTTWVNRRGSGSARADAAVASDGSTTVIWESEQLRYRVHIPGRGWSKAKAVEGRPGATSGGRENRPRVSGGQGRTVIGYQEEDGEGEDGVQVHTRLNGQRSFGPAVLAGPGTVFADIEVSDQGTTGVMYFQPASPLPGSPQEQVFVATRVGDGAFVSEPASTPLPPETSSGNSAGDIAFSSDGSTFVAWQNIHHPEYNVYVNERPPGGAFGTPADATEENVDDTDELAFAPRLVGLDGGRAAVTWIQNPSLGSDPRQLRASVFTP